MKIRQEQLTAHLEQQQLAPVYCVTGNEPLQSMEIVDSIRKAANHQGYQLRDILTVEGQFDWSSLAVRADSLSLFSEKHLIDLRIPSGKLGIRGSKAVQAYLKRIPTDKLLLIQLGKIDYRSQNAAWFKAIDQAGIIIQVWNLSPAQTQAWIAKRMQKTGLQPSGDVVHLLTERVEGNLLAAVQEIEKLYSLFGQSSINEQQLIDSVTDSSRFSTFDLSDAILSAQPQRVLHILDILQQEGMALPLLLWAITDLCRKLYRANLAIRAGKSDAAIVKLLPKPKQPLFRAANQRLYDAQWQMIWHKLVEIDWKTKGVGIQHNKLEARIWDDLADLSICLAGSGQQK